MKNKEKIRKIFVFLNALGINLLLILNFIPNLIYFIKTFFKYFRARQKIIKQQVTSLQLPKLSFPFICFGDHRGQSGEASGHYFHQDLIVASEIYKKKPEIHLDIGSRVDGFITHLVSFQQKVIIGDVRNLNFKNKFISYKKVDLSRDLKFNEHLSNFTTYESLSCLHVIEHIGLGRYGDSINPLGYLSALKNLSLLLKKNGKLYLSHPCGETRVEFNGHYIFSIDYFYKLIKKFKLTFEEIHLINDEGQYLLKTKSLKKAINLSNNFRYGCAIWFLTKI